MSSKYEFVEGGKANYPIVKMCRWAKVSTSGFYEWRNRPASPTAQRQDALRARIIGIFDDSDQSYGYRRVHEQLAQESINAGPQLVRSIMVAAALVACQPRSYKVTTVADGESVGPEDLCDQGFTAQAPGVELVGDITDVRTWAGWVYMATVIDCYSKMVIGWATADHMRGSMGRTGVNVGITQW